MPDTHIPPPKAVVLFELPESLREALDEWAYAQDISRSEALRLAICKLLDIPPLDERANHGLTKYASVQERRHAKYERRKARLKEGT